MRRYISKAESKPQPVRVLDSKGSLVKTISSKEASVLSKKRKKKERLAKKKEANLLKDHGKKKVIQFAEKLRVRHTPAEHRLVTYLRHIGISHKFQRKVQVKSSRWYIVDFLLAGLELIIEVDGGYHMDPVQKEKDKQREKDLVEATGYKVARFTNEEILYEPHKFFAMLTDHMTARYYDLARKYERQKRRDGASG